MKYKNCGHKICDEKVSLKSLESFLQENGATVYNGSAGLFPCCYENKEDRIVVGKVISVRTLLHFARNQARKELKA